MEAPVLNAHNKAEHEPSHTCEHVLNATMVAMFGCPRSRNAHVEKKKSKCDYILDAEPTAEQVTAVEEKVKIISCARLMRHVIHYGGGDSEADKRQIAWCRAELEKLLPRTDTLLF